MIAYRDLIKAAGTILAASAVALVLITTTAMLPTLGDTIFPFPSAIVESLASAEEGHDHDHDHEEVPSTAEEDHDHDHADHSEEGHDYDHEEVPSTAEEDHDHDHTDHSEEGHDHDHEEVSATVEEDHDHDHADHDHGTEKTEEGHAHSHDDESDIIELTGEMRQALQVDSEPVGRGDLVVTLDLYGWVRPLPDNMTELRAPVAGVVQDIHVRPGDFVKKGSPLVSILAPELLNLQTTVISSAIQRSGLAEERRLLLSEGRASVIELLGSIRVAAAEKSRLESELQLIEQAGAGAVSQRDINSKKGELNAAFALLEAKRALAAAYGISPELVTHAESGEGTITAPEGLVPPQIARQAQQIEMSLLESKTKSEVAIQNLRSLGFPDDITERLARGEQEALTDVLEINSGQSGLVTELRIRRRSAVNPGDDMLHIVDYCRVYVEAEVPEVDIAKVIARATDIIPIRIPGLDDEGLHGDVAFFDTAVDEDVRKAHLVLEVENVEGWALRDNMAVTVGVPLEIRKDALFVPRKSVLTDGFEKVVFVDEGEVFHRTSIRTGVQTFDSIEVLSGLSQEQSVVVSGGRVLLLGLNTPKGGGDPHAGHSH